MDHSPPQSNPSAHPATQETGHALSELLRFNMWANQSVFAAAVDLTAEQLDLGFEMGEGTLRKTLVHLYEAEHCWHERCSGPKIGELSDPSELHSIAEVRAACSRLFEIQHGWISRLDPDTIAARLSYARNQNEQYTHSLRDMLLHVVNHGVHHRAQSLNMLKRQSLAIPRVEVLSMRFLGEAPLLGNCEVIDALFKYSDWADAKILNIAMRLNESELKARFEIGCGSVLHTIHHMSIAESWWQDNWSNKEDNFWKDQDCPKSEDVINAWQSCKHLRNEFISTQLLKDLNKTCLVPIRPGKVREAKVGESLIHLWQHGTHHRHRS